MLLIVYIIRTTGAKNQQWWLLMGRKTTRIKGNLEEPSGTDGRRKKGTCSQNEEDGDETGVWDDGRRKSSKPEGLRKRILVVPGTTEKEFRSTKN